MPGDADADRAEILAEVKANTTAIEGLRTDSQTTGDSIVRELAQQRADAAVRETSAEERHEAVVAMLSSILDRLPSEEEPPPPPPRRPFFAHLPWLNDDGTSIPRSAWPGMVQARIDAGWATGAALYSSGQMVWDDTWAAFFDTFPDGVDVFLMPAEPAGMGEFCSHLSEVQRPRTYASNGQEQEKRWTDPAGWAEYRRRSQVLAAEVRPLGVISCVELNGAVGKDGVHGGITAWLAMVDPAAVDFVGYSSFSNQGGTYGIDIARRCLEIHAQYWPTIKRGMAAGGVNVAKGLPADDPARAIRAGINRDLLNVWINDDAACLAHYDVPHFSTGDYGVDAELLPVLTAASGVLAQ